MTRTTHEKIGAPEAVLILFDEINNCIGLKPTSASFGNAFPLKPSGNAGGRRIYATALFNEWSINVPETVRFRDVHLEDDILVLDLRSARVPEIVRRNWRNKARTVTATDLET